MTISPCGIGHVVILSIFPLYLSSVSEICYELPYSRLSISILMPFLTTWMPFLVYRFLAAFLSRPAHPPRPSSNIVLCCSQMVLLWFCLIYHPEPASGTYTKTPEPFGNCLWNLRQHNQNLPAESSGTFQNLLLRPH